MIDDRLQAILQNWLAVRAAAARGVLDSSAMVDLDKTDPIKAIKQAFADDDRNTITKDQGKILLTGKEWYEKFLKEWRAINLKSYSTGHYAKMAAKRASGIERKEANRG